MKAILLRLLISIVPIVVMCGCNNQKSYNKEAPGWPKVTSQQKPWTRWWWQGNAVNKQELTRCLTTYEKAGLGGVEITPIYGVKGTEEQFINYLSPEWMEMLEHTLLMADSMHMGVDMALASGWPFGGPWIGPEEACRYLVTRSFDVETGQTNFPNLTYRETPYVRTVREGRDISEIKYPISENQDSLQSWALDQVRFPVELPIAAVVAANLANGESVDLTDNMDASGNLEWQVPGGKWKLYALYNGWHGKLVERAGPGGEGNVMDHFSKKALEHHLQQFSEAFANAEVSSLRAGFSDSYEVDDARGNSDFTDGFFEHFQQLRGYDLRDHLPAFTGLEGDSISTRVVCDYRETISDLLLQKYTRPWHQWSREHNLLMRNQAHGSPANILDLYSVSDIPETEGEDLVRMKMASSAAHVTGKRLVSAEAATWLNDHFMSDLGMVKDACNRFFLGGVNHIFYHGTAYSPKDAEWPGWLFYAAVHFQPSNSWWDHFAALNSYVTKVQSFLQRGNPNNQVLLYWPFHDAISERDLKYSLTHFKGDVEGTSFRELAVKLIDAGYGVDFISDRQLENIKCKDGRIVSAGGVYLALVVPAVSFIPFQTFVNINKLATSGGEIMFCNHLPKSLAGADWSNENLVKYRALTDTYVFSENKKGYQSAGFGNGHFYIGDDIPLILEDKGIRGEKMVDLGLKCISRKEEGRYTYFILNDSERKIDGWVPLRCGFSSAIVYDPETGEYGQTSTDADRVWLQLDKGKSCLVELYDKALNIKPFSYWKETDRKISLNANPWHLKFLKGGPELPEERQLDSVMLWTSLGDDNCLSFSGTGVYSTSFILPDSSMAAWKLSIEKVFSSATVRVNGKEVKTIIDAPYDVVIPGKMLKKGENTLSVEVANLMLNRIIYMENHDMPYKRFYNINFSSHRGQNAGEDGLFTVKGWKPVPSGIEGTVVLTGLEEE
jgi:hypothetical protein